MYIEVRNRKMIKLNDVRKDTLSTLFKPLSIIISCTFQFISNFDIANFE